VQITSLYPLFIFSLLGRFPSVMRPVCDWSSADHSLLVIKQVVPIDRLLYDKSTGYRVDCLISTCTENVIVLFVCFTVKKKGPAHLMIVLFVDFTVKKKGQALRLTPRRSRRTTVGVIHATCASTVCPATTRTSSTWPGSTTCGRISVGAVLVSCPPGNSALTT
jgi:hypothetical protein